MSLFQEGQVFLTKEQLEKLNTKRILAYKRSMRRWLHPGCSCGSMGCDGDAILTHNPKAKAAVKQLHKDLAEILATREHVERKDKNARPS